MLSARICLLLSLCLFCALPSTAQQRLIPPPGIAVSDSDKSALTAKLSELNALIAQLQAKPAATDLLPDVILFQKAVAWSLADNTVYNNGEIQAAYKELDEGIVRAKSLLNGSAPWTTQTGLVVRGYKSKLDGSIQPYGLVVPESWKASDNSKRRLDLFFHGRGEQLTELAFVSERMRSGGEFMPKDAFVLHPYGRFCNANRLAGEIDVWEAIADVQRRYPIDSERIVDRGFSMGGASAWHFATQHADFWAAAAPGAGFSETAEFTGAFRDGRTPPAWYVQTLWHLYDATDYAVNLAQVPTVAYNGDKDGQKQAADAMEAALVKENLPLKRIIGVNTGHWYSGDAKNEINTIVDAAVANGRVALPENVRFTTWTLRWNKQNWVTVDGLGRHWTRARVDARRVAPAEVSANTENVTGVTFALPTGLTALTVDNQRILLPRMRNTSVSLLRGGDGKWKRITAPVKGLVKRHGSQGPIDDAFMDGFVFVRPTGISLNATSGKQLEDAMQLAVSDWHRYFRADVPIRDDTKLTDADIKSKNLILWGDSSSNAVVRRVIAKLPLRWSAAGLVVNGKTYPSGTAFPALIFPNPLNPAKYIVLNSGFTWHVYASGSNADHCPKLPDWAVLNGEGTVLDAGFFDENWRISSWVDPNVRTK